MLHDSYKNPTILYHEECITPSTKTNCFARKQALCDVCSVYCYQTQEEKTCPMYYTGVGHSLLCIKYTHKI